MSSFHPQRPQDWQTFLDRDGPPSPAPTDNLDAATLERFVGYTLQLGPIPTDDTVAVQNAITAAQLRDRHAPLHGQHVVVVDGGPMAGKTYAALRCALTQTRAAREAPPPDPACLHPATWAYVEVTQHHGIASIAQSLAGAGIALCRKNSVSASRSISPTNAGCALSALSSEPNRNISPCQP